MENIQTKIATTLFLPFLFAAFIAIHYCEGFFLFFFLQKVTCCQLCRWKVLLPWDTRDMCQFSLPVRHQMQSQQEASSGHQQQHSATHCAQPTLSLLATMNRDMALQLASKWLAWEIPKVHLSRFSILSKVNLLVMLKSLGISQQRCGGKAVRIRKHLRTTTIGIPQGCPLGPKVPLCTDTLYPVICILYPRGRQMPVFQNTAAPLKRELGTWSYIIFYLCDLVQATKWGKKALMPPRLSFVINKLTS